MKRYLLIILAVLSAVCLAGCENGSGSRLWTAIPLLLLGLAMLGFAILRTRNFCTYCRIQRKKGRGVPKTMDLFTWGTYIVAAILLLSGLLLARLPVEEPQVEAPPETEPATEATMNPYLCDTPAERLVIFAREQGLTMNEWSQELLTLLEKNPDAEEYVQNYPFKKDTELPTDLSDQVGTGQVPLLLQWDERWGYTTYGSGPMGITACGPTCLSMACLYFLEDARYTPRYIADFAEENGYYAWDSGTSWSLMSEGAQSLGLKVDTIPPVAAIIMENLEAGNLVMCAMGPGIFTENGHYILLAGAKDGKAIVNDPNSPTNSAKLWDVSEFEGEISALWVYKPIEE